MRGALLRSRVPGDRPPERARFAASVEALLQRLAGARVLYTGDALQGWTGPRHRAPPGDGQLQPRPAAGHCHGGVHGRQELRVVSRAAESHHTHRTHVVPQRCL